MGWSVDEEGLGVIFDRAIPPFAEENLRPAVDAILARQALARGRRRSLRLPSRRHQGVAAIETALGLEPGTLDHERAVLAEYGNMSAPTALFVLERRGRRRACRIASP